MIENYQEMLRNESNGFIRHNGRIRIVSVDEEKSVLKAEITDLSRNVWGGVHGGFLYTMADTAAGAFARIELRPAQRNAQRLDQLSALRCPRRKTSPPSAAKAQVGGHVGFFEVNITDEEERLIARAEANMYFLQE